MAALLGVNIDHVATLRQARGTTYPDPVNAALICEQAGAEILTMQHYERVGKSRTLHMTKL